MDRASTPRGFRDVLPQEAAEREEIVAAMSSVMDSWGYGPVETPVVELADTLVAAMAGSDETRAFRLFDADGELLALRPEMTVPIARLVATRIGTGAPRRLRYVSDVFREQASLRGQSRQFTQIGLELVGETGPSADAEVITVLTSMLRASGLPEFTVGYGTVAVWRALTRAAGMGDEWEAEVMAAAHERNIAGIDVLAGAEGVPDAARDALRSVPRIRGGIEAIDACSKATAGLGTDESLAEMRAIWRLLEASGAADSVTVDFGIMRSFDYYTGMVLEVYAPGIGLPLGGGGRYDDVLAEFGSPAAAAGFAVGIERLHIAIAEQGVASTPASVDVVVGGDPVRAFLKAAELRGAGERVAIAVNRDEQELEAVRNELGAERAVFVTEGGEA